MSRALAAIPRARGRIGQGPALCLAHQRKREAEASRAMMKQRNAC
jgi:hypothetical protein